MNRGDWRVPLQFAALLLSGLLAGANLAVWRGYDPRGFSPQTFLEVHQNAVGGLGTLLPAIGIACTALVIGLAALSRRRPIALWLYVAALVALAVGGLITRTVSQPITAALLQGSAAMPENWAELRDQWWLWQVRITVLAILAQALLIAAVMADRRWQPAEPARPAVPAAPPR